MIQPHYLPLHQTTYSLCVQQLLCHHHGSFVQADIYSKKRWRWVQLLANQFWSHWKKEFLQTLQKRQKWTGQQRNMTRGDIVIIKEDDTPRGHWKLGRVEECHPSADGIIRSVKIAIGDSKLDERGRRTQPVSYLTRPITKLVLLLESVAAVELLMSCLEAAQSRTAEYQTK